MTVFTTVFLVLSILLFAVAVPATWARRTLLDTDWYGAGRRILVDAIYSWFPTSRAKRPLQDLADSLNVQLRESSADRLSDPP